SDQTQGISVQNGENRNGRPARAGKEWMGETDSQLPLDVYQTEQEIVVQSLLAGITVQDIDISLTNDMLTVKGVRAKDSDVPAANYYYRECYFGPFSRSVILPHDVDPEHINARLKNGILTITLKKSAQAKTKKITVDAP
ncbi:MAG: Hsp20/alpha crystallin family protein, partial [Patescibacteria group bacterium]